jgi:hypothetical protein
MALGPAVSSVVIVRAECAVFHRLGGRRSGGAATAIGDRQSGALARRCACDQVRAYRAHGEAGCGDDG